MSCFQYVKGTKKKANHNRYPVCLKRKTVVSNTSKVLKRKQITTRTQQCRHDTCCFQYVKGTKKKANHNQMVRIPALSTVVSNTSKVLKRKQITTLDRMAIGAGRVVSNTSKVLKRKQITTEDFS